jgi:hypothetical protein
VAGTGSSISVLGRCARETMLDRGASETVKSKFFNAFRLLPRQIKEPQACRSTEEFPQLRIKLRITSP